jgi:hypothetical protein
LTPEGPRFFYLSIITLTSVGFGEMAPVHPFARSMVMFEGILGQVYTAVLLARLVSLEILNRSRNRPLIALKHGSGASKVADAAGGTSQ